MGLIREPKNVDFTVQSKPWTEEELRDFRELMNKMKLKNAKRKLPSLNAVKKNKKYSEPDVDFVIESLPAQKPQNSPKNKW